MTKLEFLAELRQYLAGLPLEDIEKSVDYYKESIDDRMEDGLTEEEAVAAMGDTKTIASEILAEASLPPVVKKLKKPLKPKTRGWEIVLLILGFPLWFPLLMSFAAIVLSVYIVLWTVAVSLYSLPVAFGASALALLLTAVVNFLTGGFLVAVLASGCCLVLAGLCIFSILLCNLLVKAAAWCTKMLWRCLKNLFVKKEAAK